MNTSLLEYAGWSLVVMFVLWRTGTLEFTPDGGPPYFILHNPMPSPTVTATETPTNGPVSTPESGATPDDGTTPDREPATLNPDPTGGVYPETQPASFTTERSQEI